MKINIPDKSYKFIFITSTLIATCLLFALPALATGTNQRNDWMGALLPYLIVIAFIAIMIFFPVFAGFLSATAGLIILGLIILLLGSCFTGGIVWEGSGNPNNIFNVLLSHFYIYIGIILIVLDLAMLGSIIVSIIGVGFIVWDIGSSVWHGGKPTWGDIDVLVFWGLTGITVIVAFIYSLRKNKKVKNNQCPSCGAIITSPEQLYCTGCGKELRK